MKKILEMYLNLFIGQMFVSALTVYNSKNCYGVKVVAVVEVRGHNNHHAVGSPGGGLETGAPLPSSFSPPDTLERALLGRRAL